MTKTQSWFKKILKIILWVILGFVLLFLIIAALIQIPAIQTRIVHYATSLVSDKTHTRVEIKHVGISFPKSVVLQGIYLEDAQKDTLLSAGKLKVNIALFDLLFQKIAISSVALEEVNLRLYNTKTDSLFNYNFLLTAFNDTTKAVKPDTLSPSKWTFSIDEVDLENIRVRYEDEYGGSIIVANLKSLELKTDEIDFKKSIYRIDYLLVDSLNGSFLIKESAKIQNNKSKSILPFISAQKIQIHHSNIRFADSIGKLSVLAMINQFQLKDASADLQNQTVSLEKLFLSESDIRYNSIKLTSDSVSEKPKTATENNWKVTAERIELDDNAFTYITGNKPETKGSFDVNHMQYQHLSLEATDLSYSPELTKVSVEKFSAIDQNNFEIKNFETDFSMDQQSIAAKNLKLNTTNSAIDADLSIEYTSMKSFADSLQFRTLLFDMKEVVITNSDVLYFSPPLGKQDFFKDSKTITYVSGIVTGQKSNLNGKNLLIKTGTNTILKTDFNIAGFNQIKTANFDFPNLNLSSGRKDIEMMASAYLPESIALPEVLNAQIVFKGQLKSFKTTADLTSSFGAVQLAASIDKLENFSSKVNLTDFNLGSLLKDTAMYGQVSLIAEANGHGLDKNTIDAKIKAEVSKFGLKNYTYHNLNLEGKLKAQEFEGTVNLKDENVVFDLDALVNLDPDQGFYKFRLDLQGADLQKLNLSNSDVRIGMIATADFEGGSVNKLNGKASIANIVVVHKAEKYQLDSVVITALNTGNKSEFNLSSGLVDLKYSGGVFPTRLQIDQFISSYFQFSDSIPTNNDNQLSDFNFEIQLHNHPILSKVIFPQLYEFQPGIIQGSFDSTKSNLQLKVVMNKVVYGTTEMKDFTVDVNSDLKALKYKIACGNISNAQAGLEHLLIEGKLADNKINTGFSSLDEKKNKKLMIVSEIIKKGDNYRLTLDPKDFYLMSNRWDIAADNFIEFGKEGYLIHHFFMNHAESQVNIASVNDKFNDDLNIAIRNFKLDDISGIIEKDTSFIKGNADGNLLLKRVNNSYGLIADAAITDLFVSNVSIGNLTVKAENATTDKFNVELNLSGAENNLRSSGYFIPNGGDQSIHIETVIEALSLETVEALSMGSILDATGNLKGNVLVEGNINTPEITGEIIFDNAFITPAVLNNPLELKHESFQLKKDGLYFNSFTLLDVNKNKAVINGVVKMNRFSNFQFNLKVNTKDFLLFNTTAKNNKEFYGRMIIDSKIDVTGPMSLPVVNANLKLKKGSNFTFAVPEENLSTDKGESVVEFESGFELNPILYKEEKKVVQKTNLTGYDVSSIIEIDKEATLRLLLDPASSDSLVVKGEAALSFSIDRSGKMSLTGAYHLNDGSYIVSLESIVKRRFDIDRGSTIIWSGDPLDAAVSINAIYSVRASPIDLMADQMIGMSEAEKGGYKQRYPFLVLLKLRGELLHPEIGFEIQLMPQDKGILGGAVNQKLILLNEDASALNKQVFALLVLGRFIQENPLQTDASGSSTLVRATVGKFLSQQLNKWSSKVIPGVDLNFDIQSYNDYQTGQAEGRTQVDIGLKKQLFNERLSIELGGSVDVEGDKAKQNSASDITSDVTVEYKLTRDGRYRIKGFRHNKYEGVIEGQFVETGTGILYVRDFDKWKEFFKSPQIKSDSLEIKSDSLDKEKKK